MNGKEGGDCARELTLSGFNTDKARTKHVNLVNFFFPLPICLVPIFIDDFLNKAFFCIIWVCSRPIFFLHMYYLCVRYLFYLQFLKMVTWSV